MTHFVLKLYEYLRRRRYLLLLLFLVLTGIFLFQLTRINYKEDISDFLPLDDTHQKALDIYQHVSGANNIFAVFQLRESGADDPDAVVETINRFVAEIQQRDSCREIQHITSQIDFEQIADVADFVYHHLPYFLTDADYQRIDSLLALPDYVATRLQDDKQMLLFPSGGLLLRNLQRDPLQLFTPVVAELQASSASLHYEMYDGHIFSPDMQKAFVVIESPYGSNETEKNQQMVALLQQCADAASGAEPRVEIHLTGGPVIAVTNATQIKTDSLLSIAIAVVLILLVLFYSFRSLRHICLIILSIGWGWLFGLASLAVINHHVSMIVVGISSVILGIAVNYPLHLIAHSRHAPDVRHALSDIVPPLVVGNITTVGAFLCLVPLQSVALRDLGIFSSFLLIGTIVFVLLFLPHLIRPHRSARVRVLEKVSMLKLENYPSFVVLLLLLTLVLAYFSTQTKFDTNMSHINFMTAQQADDLAYFQKNMMGASDYQSVYVVNEAPSLDEALRESQQLQPEILRLQEEQLVHQHRACPRYLSTEHEQQQRLHSWESFLGHHQHLLTTRLSQEARRQGFSDESFSDFRSILSAQYPPLNQMDEARQDSFCRTVESLSAPHLHFNPQSNTYAVIDILSVVPAQIEVVEQRLASRLHPGGFSFDVASMQSAISSTLSSHFNYIGWACGFIVFFFLWFSLGSLELSILSFLPMAISWIWILGIMSLCDIQFNIVNIILASFIFGQGDDYTIFMTEGACYEYAYRRKMLASYKSAILLSALIMFIGIGSLIFARHPALFSLAEVTIVGMFAVVLMAYVFPPFIFRFLVMKNGAYRERPLSFSLLFSSLFPRLNRAKDAETLCAEVVTDRYRYKGAEVMSAVRRHLRSYLRHREWLRLPRQCSSVVILDSGYGEFPLLYALLHPDVEVIVCIPDRQHALLAKYSAQDVVRNISLVDSPSSLGQYLAGAPLYLVSPSAHHKSAFQAYQPLIIE